MTEYIRIAWRLVEPRVMFSDIARFLERHDFFLGKADILAVPSGDRKRPPGSRCEHALKGYCRRESVGVVTERIGYDSLSVMQPHPFTIDKQYAAVLEKVAEAGQEPVAMPEFREPVLAIVKTIQTPGDALMTMHAKSIAWSRSASRPSRSIRSTSLSEDAA